MVDSLLDEVQAEVRKGVYRFTLHAGARMTERHIAVREVEEALLDDKAEVIEDYPKDPRGPSCLILGWTGEKRPLHIQCSHPPGVAVITAYEPDPVEWLDWRRRRGKGK